MVRLLVLSVVRDRRTNPASCNTIVSNNNKTAKLSVGYVYFPFANICSNKADRFLLGKVVTKLPVNLNENLFPWDELFQ